MTAAVDVEAPARVHPVGTEQGDVDVPIYRLDPIAYAELVDAHPAGDDDPPGLPWSEAEFPPALFAAACRVPRIVAREWWRDWPEDAADELLQAVLEVHTPGSVEWALHRLAGDARLDLELAYCGPNGIPHDEFLRWSRRSQDLAIAWQIRRVDRCPGCGVPASAMQDVDAADVDVRACVHCDSRHALTETIPEDERHRVHVLVVPIRHREG